MCTANQCPGTPIALCPKSSHNSKTLQIIFTSMLTLSQKRFQKNIVPLPVPRSGSGSPHSSKMYF